MQKGRVQPKKCVLQTCSKNTVLCTYIDKMLRTLSPHLKWCTIKRTGMPLPRQATRPQQLLLPYYLDHMCHTVHTAGQGCTCTCNRASLGQAWHTHPCRCALGPGAMPLVMVVQHGSRPVRIRRWAGGGAVQPQFPFFLHAGKRTHPGESKCSHSQEGVLGVGPPCRLQCSSVWLKAQNGDAGSPYRNVPN